MRRCRFPHPVGGTRIPRGCLQATVTVESRVRVAYTQPPVMHTPARSDSTIKAGRLPGTTGYFLVPRSEFAVLVYTHYRPAHLDWDYWDEIRFFVTKAVSTVLNNEDDEDDVVRRYMRVFAWFCYDMHHLGGRELTYESLLTRANINYHVGHYLNDKSDNVRGASRGVLEALARALNPDWDGDDGKRRFGDSTAVAPYTPDELALVRKFPVAQTNKDRVDKARVLLGLTLGAGLRHCEVEGLRYCDVRAIGDTLCVYPSGYRGAPVREVPVSHKYDEWLSYYVQILSENFPAQRGFLFAPGREVADSGVLRMFLRRAGKVGVPIRPGQLRATWIVDHMQAGVPDSVICAAAGLQDLQHYKRYRPPATGEQARRLLAGPGGPQPLRLV